MSPCLCLPGVRREGRAGNLVGLSEDHHQDKNKTCRKDSADRADPHKSFPGPLVIRDVHGAHFMFAVLSHA